VLASSSYSSDTKGKREGYVCIVRGEGVEWSVGGAG
jgi:hypothetical protein